MSHLSLRMISKGNWEVAIRLSVKEEQQRFIASNLYSIAEVQFLENFYAKGIYLDNKMIGFTMYGIDPDDQNYWIYRLMIDKEFQGTGLGGEAIKLVVNEMKLRNETHLPFILIGYHPENLAAKHSYKKAGFIETELAPWGEQLAKYNLF